MTYVADTIGSLFYEKMEEAWKDAPGDVRSAARRALDETLESVAGKRVFGNAFDYENQFGFFILGVDGRPIAGRVRMADAVALAELLDGYRKRNPK